MRQGLLIFIATCFLCHCNARESSICLTVCDIDSRTPVPDAFVFISNTEYGGATELNGSCHFDYPAYVNQVLVIFHPEFNTKNIPFRLYKNYVNCDTVYIQKNKSNNTSALTPSRSRKWQRQFKKFKRYFVGSSKAASKCEILNPQDLHFREENDVFLATAKNMLQIRNEHLGYEISFLLTEFRIEADGSSRYQGKAKFTDITDKENYERIQSNRKKAFERSPKYFYQALIYDDLENKGFEIKLEKLENNAFTLLSEPTPTDLVEYKPGSNSFYLRFIEFLTVIDGNHKIRNELLKTFGLSLAANNRINNASREDRVKLSDARSYLYKTSAYLEIDMYGNLLNPDKLQEYGYWASQRLAEQLPYYYGNAHAEDMKNEFLSNIRIESDALVKNNPDRSSKDTIINGFTISNLLIPLREIKYGGVPKDGIPAIDNPVFQRTEHIDYLNDEDLLLIINLDDTIKAYPLKVLNRHEIINDDHLIISYCPLCHSGIVFDVSQENDITSFGVSGLLYQSDLLMYDRNTQSLWSQIESKCIAGPLSGKTLQVIPSQYISWSDLKNHYANAIVLDAPGENKSRYNQVVYANYNSSDRLMFPVSRKNALLPNKTEVIGITLENKSVAIPIDKIKEADQGVKYIIANSIITAKFEQGTFKVFDEELNPIPFQHMYWFAWYAFHPETTIYAK